MTGTLPLSRPGVWFLAALAAACGDATTGPADDFAVDPSPVVGSWYTVSTSLATPDQTFIGRIETGQGFLTGEFVFEVSSQLVVIPFIDGRWDGSALRFFTPDYVAGSSETMSWTGLLIPPEGDAPTQLRLFPRVAGGVPYAVTYVRFRDLDFLR